jgi:hypothetical protein
MKWIMTVLIGLVMPQIAVAAPYCVAVQGLPDQCIFVDGQLCEARASQLGGVCKSNPDDIVAQSGPGQFCLVIGGQATLCIFPDRNSCQEEAIRRHSACVHAAAPPQQAVDPFAIRRPY